MRTLRKPRAWVLRIALCVSLTCAGLVVASPVAQLSPTPEWTTVTDRSLEIAAGSALDFSALAGDLASDVPLTIKGEELMLDGRRPQINCAMLGPGFSVTPGSGFPDHPTADRYAEQLRRHGYNLVRLHHIDSLLMKGSTQDLAFDRVALDRYHYLLAALKRNGIRWSLDLMTSDNGALGGVFPNRWSERRGMRIRLYVEPAAFRHWQALATQLLTEVNPYTGLAPARDPGTAMLVLLNEGVITHQAHIADKGRQKFPDVLKEPYAAWLREHREASVASLPRLGERGPAAELFQRFLNERQIAVARRMEETVRAAGYRGPLTAFDSWDELNAVPSRRRLALVDMHGYDQVPPGGVPGAVVRQISSLELAAPYLGSMASARFFGRPFVSTEHDQPFWNPYRYESGLVVPAIAALQDWQFTCRHSDGPIALAYDGLGVRKQALYPDGIGLDPVARAAETLTALLWLRREIAVAQPSVGFLISDDESVSDGGVRGVPPGLDALAWVARIGLFDERSRLAGAKPDLFVPLGSSPTVTERAVARWGRGAAEPVLMDLRARGLIPSTNGTNPAAHIWESPNGQVRLDGEQRTLLVETSRTAALAAERLSGPIVIGPIRVTAMDAPALLGFSALDGHPLAKSLRVLVVLASDARNTGQQVAPDGTLMTLGQLPIQLRRVRASVTLAVPASSLWRLSPLRLNGTPDPAVQFRAGPDGLPLILDTAQSLRGPTTFFLLERF